MSLFADPGVRQKPAKPQLADPRPPQPPAPTMTTCQPRSHDLVVWYYSGRVVKTSYATKDKALDALKACAADEWATAYRGVVYDQRSEVARIDIEAESTLRRRAFAEWLDAHKLATLAARDD